MKQPATHPALTVTNTPTEAGLTSPLCEQIIGEFRQRIAQDEATCSVAVVLDTAFASGVPKPAELVEIFKSTTRSK